MTIETSRLILRSITKNDAEDIFEYSKGTNVGPNAGWKPHEAIEETCQIIELIFLDKENVYGIILKESGKLIGSIGLINDPKREYDRVKMLGYAIGEKYWGKGYMTEASKAVIQHGFSTLNLDIISAYCYPFNEKSKNVLRKLGFQYEGTLSLCEKLYNGQLLDHECYTLKKSSHFFK